MPIPSENQWAWAFEGYFTQQNSQPLFIFRDQSVCAVSRVDGQPHTVYAPFIPDLPISKNWQLREDLNSPLLLLTDKSAIDLQTFKIVPHDYTLQKRSAYPCWDLGEYHIDYNAITLLSCTKNGAKAWQFRMRAYLYTPIYQWNDLIFFGTAGHGGYLYILRLDTGDVIAAIKTGGTVCIAQEGLYCYVLANAPKAKLLKLLLDSGSIAEEVPLPGKAQYSSLRLMNGEVHAITYVFRNNQLSQALWNCVALS